MWLVSITKSLPIRAVTRSISRQTFHTLFAWLTCAILACDTICETAEMCDWLTVSKRGPPKSRGLCRVYMPIAASPPQLLSPIESSTTSTGTSHAPGFVECNVFSSATRKSTMLLKLGRRNIVCHNTPHRVFPQTLTRRLQGDERAKTIFVYLLFSTLMFS